MHRTHQPVLDLKESQQQPEPVKSPTGVIFTPYQKMGALVLVLCILYYRFFLKRRSKDKVCAHCGHRNPPHRSNCTKCSAPLFVPR